jgi:hypothetical protein
MAKRSRKTTRTVEEPSPLLERLKEIAVASGLEVREERLLREVGYSVRSGICRVDDHEVVLLDRNASSAERIEFLCNLLSGRDLDSVFIEPEIRRSIGGRALVVDDQEPAAAERVAGPEQESAAGPA